MENVIYIVLAIVWVIVQIAARSARKNKPAKPPELPPFHRDVPESADRGRPPALDPEEELRRFLRELSGAPAEPRPAAAPPPISPPARARPPMAATAAPTTGRGGKAWRKRHPVAPAADAVPLPPPDSTPAAVPAETPTQVTLLEDRTAPAMGTVSMAAVPMAAVQPFRSVTFSAGGPSRMRRRTALPRGRGAWSRAVIYQAVLGPPRGLQPYGEKELLG